MQIQKLLFLLFLSVIVVSRVHGFYIQPDGVNAAFMLNKGDSLLFFDGAPVVKTSDDSKVDWYKIPDTINPITTNASSCFLFEHGDGIFAKNDSMKAVCFVFDYQQIKPNIASVDVTFFCDGTELVIPISNSIPEISYRAMSGMRRVVSRNMNVSFYNTEWKETKWDSTTNNETFELEYGTKYLAPIYLSEPTLKIQYDDIANNLYGHYYEVADINYINMPIAVSSHPTTTTSVRTALNEKERPSDASQVSGSAPLDIFFQSNPSPNVAYITWRIYKGSEFLVQRNIQDHRYEFTDYGNYRAVCYVSNSYCPCAPDEECERDSTQIDITVGSSLIRVPNVFTPNGDGVNDEFRVLYRSIRQYHIEVYNRWGKLVYSSNDPSKGWDGTINNRPASVGAYYYVIRAIGYDASPNAKFKSKIAFKKAQKNDPNSQLGVYQLSGDINLIR